MTDGPDARRGLEAADTDPRADAPTHPVRTHMTGPVDYPPEQLPAHDRLADADDELDWNREAHGLMASAASDDEPETVLYDPANDTFL